MSRAIRIDPEVYERLRAERRPEETNFNAAITRILWRRRALDPKSSAIDPEIRKHLRKWL